MLNFKYALYLSLVCYSLVLLESAQASTLQPRRQFFDSSTNTDLMEDLENQLSLRESRSFSPGAYRRLAFKRGFVRLG